MSTKKQISINQDEIFLLVSKMGDCGYGEEYLFKTLAGWAGKVTDQEINDYSDTFIDRGRFGRENADKVLYILEDWVSFYGEND
jgi:hypothetical protein